MSESLEMNMNKYKYFIIEKIMTDKYKIRF